VTAAATSNTSVEWRFSRPGDLVTSDHPRGPRFLYRDTGFSASCGSLEPGELGMVIASFRPNVTVLVLTERGELGWCYAGFVVTVGEDDWLLNRTLKNRAGDRK